MSAAAVPDDIGEAAGPGHDLAELEQQLYGGGDEGDEDDSDAGAADTGGAADGGDQSKPISKNQMKKLARLERKKAQRLANREREKAAKAAKRVATTERKAAELAGMTEEQKKALREEKQAKLLAHREADKQLKERLKQSLIDGPRVVIDLDFEDKMTDNDLRHVIKQLGFCYSANKTAEQPVHMMLTSFKGGVATSCNKLISGLENWHITRIEESYLEHFADEKQQVVYLTADAEEELTDLDRSKVYVIGGLVDHNRYKGLCERQARAAGIATARLPISRHIQLASRAVLTVNHVFQILVEYYCRKDWAATLDFVLPLRKRAEYVEEHKQRVKGGAGGASCSREVSVAAEDVNGTGASGEGAAAAEAEVGAQGGAEEGSRGGEDAVLADSSTQQEGRVGEKRKADGDPE